LKGESRLIPRGTEASYSFPQRKRKKEGLSNGNGLNQGDGKVKKHKTQADEKHFKDKK
jgi:hypothetical protein